jgi:hypothetical protein
VLIRKLLRGGVRLRRVCAEAVVKGHFLTQERRAATPAGVNRRPVSQAATLTFDASHSGSDFQGVIRSGLIESVSFPDACAAGEFNLEAIGRRATQHTIILSPPSTTSFSVLMCRDI